MVQRINHSATSAVATAGMETVKGGLLGVIAVGVVGALLLGGGAALAVGAVGAIAGGATIGSALTSGVGLAVMGVSALVGGVAGVSSGGMLGAIVGGVAGLFRGGSKVGAEKSAFEHRREIMTSAKGQIQNGADQAALQQAYTVGVQAGQQSVVQELQRVHAQMIEGQMAQEATKNPVGPHTAKLAQQRAATEQAVSGQQVG
ncbi:MAG: hypothetical protein ACN2B6_06955 [Rickettsiales bacterium]